MISLIDQLYREKIIFDEVASKYNQKKAKHVQL